MNIVIDANILFSALIKDSITRKLILEYDTFFLFPSYIFTEMKHHRSELLEKSKLSEEDFDTILRLLLTKVVIVPRQVLLPYREDAFEIVRNIDPNDVLFIACALVYHPAIIWSDDKNLKKQSKVRVINTKEMIQLR